MAKFSLRKVDKSMKALKGDYSEHELECITRRGTIIDLAPGKTIFEEGKTGSEAAVIISGQVKITRGSEVIKHLESGAVIGEAAVLTGEARNASASTISVVKVSVLDHEQFLALLEECPDFRGRVANEFEKRAA